MSHFFTEDQQAIRDVARQFAREEVDQVAIEMDLTDELNEDLVKRVAELGFFGLMIPEEFGGIDAGITSTCAVLEEIAWASPALSGLLAVQIGLMPACLVAAGTEEQKRRFLVPSARGENLMAISITEPVGVLNIADHSTRLTPDGDGYRLNGMKIFCTQGTGTVFMVGAQTSDGDQSGYGEILVDKSMEGVEVGKYESKLGWRGSRTGTVIYNNVAIPKENILGGLLTGIGDVGMGNLMGYLSHTASSLGCMQGLFDKTIEYVKGRELYGSPMTNLQPLSYWIADAWMRIEACRALLYNTTRMFDEGRGDPTMVAACKAHICETAVEVCDRLLQMWGGHGIMTDMGINRYLRDAQTNTVAEGSSEIWMSQIASDVLS